MLKKTIPMLLFTAAALILCAEPADAKRWKEVEKALDFKRGDLAEVKAAPEAERPTALLRYYQKKYPFLPTPGAAISQKTRKTADEALKHRFQIREAPVSYRGEFPNFDWDTNAALNGDKGWMWIFQRHAWWSDLATVYLATGDERYMKEFMGELNSWVEAMFQPERKKHLGWRSLEIGCRLGVWNGVFPKLVGSPLMDEKTLVNYLYAMNRQIDILDRGFDRVPKDRLGNFQVIEQGGVLTGSLRLLELKASAGRVKRAAARLGEIQRATIFPDGVTIEFIPGYHSIYPHRFFLARQQCAAAGIDNAFDAEYNNSLERSIDVIMAWCHPDGFKPMFGDTFIDGPCFKLMKKYHAGFPHRQDWLYFATDGKRGIAPAWLVRIMPDAGYGVMRSDWSRKAFFVVAKNSDDKRKQYHNQPDNMTFELSFGGKRLMADSGSYSYHGDLKWRNRFRSSAFHQTVTLGMANNALRGHIDFSFEGPQLKALVFRNTPHDDLEHVRLFLMIDNRYLVICDVLTGKAAGELRSHYQFNPGEINLDAAQLRASNADISVTGDAGTLVKEEGFISYKYGFKEPRPAFAFLKNKEAGKPQYFVTAIMPGKIGGHAKLVREADGDGLIRNIVALTTDDGKRFNVAFDLERRNLELIPDEAVK